MSFSFQKSAVLAATAAAAVGGVAIAGAATGITGSTGSTGSTGAKKLERDGRHGHGEAALTGDTAAKVKAAALATLPGSTVLRVESDRDGIYEAHVRKADGTEVEVKIDKAFAVTAVEERGRPDGPRGRDRAAAEAPHS